jgi:hypothetical protein
MRSDRLRLDLAELAREKEDALLRFLVPLGGDALHAAEVNALRHLLELGEEHLLRAVLSELRANVAPQGCAALALLQVAEELHEARPRDPSS